MKPKNSKFKESKSKKVKVPTRRTKRKGKFNTNRSSTKSNSKRKSKGKGKSNRKSVAKKLLKSKRNNNFNNLYDFNNNSNNLLMNNAEEALPDICYDVKRPTRVVPKTKRIFALIGHSSLCSYKDLKKIKAGRESRGFRLKLDDYKSDEIKNVTYLSMQNIGEQLAQQRMALFINQLKTNEPIYSSLLEVNDIASADNFSRLIDCELKKTNPEFFYSIREKYFKEDDPEIESKTIFNVNVFPKKDKDGRQNPINSNFSFDFKNPRESAMGIYELTTTPIPMDLPVTTTTHTGSLLQDGLDDLENNNSEYEWEDIHYNEFLFNKLCQDAFFPQKRDALAKYNALQKLHLAGTHVPTEILSAAKFNMIKSSLMIPNYSTKVQLEELYKRPTFTKQRFDDFTWLNSRLYKHLLKTDQETASLSEMVDIITRETGEYGYDEEIIILDFGCKGITDLDYKPNEWKKPAHIHNESTVTIPYTLRKEVGKVYVPGRSDAKWDTLLATLNK